MKNLKETDIKYLAGLLDADGSLNFCMTKYKDLYNVQLQLVLQQSDGNDKEGEYIKWLCESCGSYQYIDLSGKNPNWKDAHRWTVKGQEVLGMLLPRLIKHMVIKASHWQRIWDLYLSLDKKSVSEEQALEIKRFSELSRKNAGPLKPKVHPTWAWVAGYLDGDGCYHIRRRKKNWGVFTELVVKVTAYDGDVVSLHLLQKAFGGSVKSNSYENTYTWSRNLGNKDKSFAIHFLRKVHRHSRLKKWKIEQLLHHHLQRLTEIDPEG